MRRLRIAFVLLVIGLALPMGWLIQRALGGVQIEREAQNRAVAERVFDEMERTLSDFLRAEEERPASHYAFYFRPEGSAADTRVRSPLATLPRSPFVVGYFQVNPDDTVQTPLIPPDRVAATRRGDFLSSIDVEARAARILEVASELDFSEFSTLSRFPPIVFTQAPGTTRIVTRDAGFGRPIEQDSASSGAFDVLQSLNRGARERATRAKKESTFSAAAPPGPPREEALALADDLGPEADGEAPIDAVLRGRLEELPGASERLADLPIRVAVHPFTGRQENELFVLTRTVDVGSRVLRQGVLIDLDEMLSHLRRQTVVEGALDDAALELAFAADLIGTDRPRYRHRFGEPFDALTVDLLLAPLGDVAGAGAVLLLSALSLGVMGIALFALYRMVAVTVSFAERRSNFVAAVSHELKTPLTAIRMYAEMLRDGLVPSDDKKNEYYESITAESERLSRLINNVLEFSRLERGTRELDLKLGDVGLAVREAAELLEPHAKRHGQVVDVEIEPDLPSVLFERDALLQVLFNLVDNALKYARQPRKPVIEMSCRRVGEGVVISVRDHGPGVDPRHEQRILEPFYRGEDELTRSAQGTGIGLALVKELADEMGAVVSVGNVSGGGFRAALRMAPA